MGQFKLLIQNSCIFTGYKFLLFKPSDLCLILSTGSVRAEDEVDVDGTVEEDLGKSRDGSRTDDEVVQR